MNVLTIDLQKKKKNMVHHWVAKVHTIQTKFSIFKDPLGALSQAESHCLFHIMCNSFFFFFIIFLNQILVESVADLGR